MMISCKHASSLLSLAEDRTLSLKERVQLRLHLLICRCCLAFQKNLKVLRLGLKELSQMENEESNQTEFQDRLKKAVQRKIDGND